jgi:hypothetical protein
MEVYLAHWYSPSPLKVQRIKVYEESYSDSAQKGKEEFYGK